MTAHRLTSVLTLALAFASFGLACGDDAPATVPDASSTGGRGGTGGSAGRGGTGGGTGGTTAGTGGSTAGTGGSTAGTGGAGGTAGTGGSPADGGTDVTADVVASDTVTEVDMAVDAAVTPDLPPDLTPDTTPSTTVMVSDCAQFNCPALTSIASQCNGNDSVCRSDTTMELPMRHTNYCHANGVKKQARTTYAGTGYTTELTVKKPDGSACYNLQIVGSGSGTQDVQNWTFRNPGGEQLATAVWRASDGRLTIICGGVNYVIGDVGCAGTDGQPDETGSDCPDGTCAP